MSSVFNWIHPAASRTEADQLTARNPNRPQEADPIDEVKGHAVRVERKQNRECTVYKLSVCLYFFSNSDLYFFVRILSWFGIIFLFFSDSYEHFNNSSDCFLFIFVF